MSAQTKNPGDDVGHANPASLPPLAKSPVGSVKGKEAESSASLRKEEDKIMVQIRTTAEAYDREKLGEVEKLVEGARRALVEPEVGPDVEDAGVFSPQTRAEEVVAGGSTIEVGTSENIYKKGLHTKIAGHVKDKVVVGVSSLAALAMWIGRLVKMAHKHTMKVVFKRGSSD